MCYSVINPSFFNSILLFRDRNNTVRVFLDKSGKFYKIHRKLIYILIFEKLHALLEIILFL